jgi:hypothetical protein
VLHLRPARGAKDNTHVPLPLRHDHSSGILGNRSVALVHVGRVRTVGDGHYGRHLDADPRGAESPGAKRVVTPDP